MQSTASRIKYFYDDAGGTPVEITAFVLNNPEIKLSNVLDRATPYGVNMPVFENTDQGEMAPITLSALFKSGTGLDPLFAGRIPEAPEASTRTFTVQYLGDTERSLSVETRLQDYSAQPNRENGLTRATAVLQPTGEVTETFPT
jgi:hypothetical protein